MLALAARWRALPDRRRVAAIAIVLLVHLLLLLAFLRLGVFSGGPPGPRAITAFNIADNKPAAKAEAQKQKSKAKAKAQSAITPPVAPPPPPQNWVLGDPALRTFNLAETPSTAPAPPQQSAEASSGPADSPAVGTGPNGQTLYAAEWVREPTDQELSYYIGQRARGGYYAIIACRTVARYKVEDCVPITERPQGSGLARSIVNAAWQFLVRPPRLDGKLKVGEWVSIRIDIREEKGG
jgi:protein TonB